MDAKKVSKWGAVVAGVLALVAGVVGAGVLASGAGILAPSSVVAFILAGIFAILAVGCFTMYKAKSSQERRKDNEEFEVDGRNSNPKTVKDPKKQLIKQLRKQLKEAKARLETDIAQLNKDKARLKEDKARLEKDKKPYIKDPKEQVKKSLIQAKETLITKKKDLIQLKEQLIINAITDLIQSIKDKASDKCINDQRAGIVGREAFIEQEEGKIEKEEQRIKVSERPIKDKERLIKDFKANENNFSEEDKKVYQECFKWFEVGMQQHCQHGHCSPFSKKREEPLDKNYYGQFNEVVKYLGINKHYTDQECKPMDGYQTLQEGSYMFAMKNRIRKEGDGAAKQHLERAKLCHGYLIYHGHYRKTLFQVIELDKDKLPASAKPMFDAEQDTQSENSNSPKK